MKIENIILDLRQRCCGWRGKTAEEEALVTWFSGREMRSSEQDGDLFHWRVVASSTAAWSEWPEAGGVAGGPDDIVKATLMKSMEREGESFCYLQGHGSEEKTICYVFNFIG
ncbi:uncharacterized protein G2W53_002538 [Senna tora]|uniref:Uncharacterized protein n=1 Tax=Senna tora TaxID=362788 RepID=A0A835CHG9_9FABA|nr:uncharacterized protein G2W53_002538 [Senna tora]